MQDPFGLCLAEVFKAMKDGVDAEKDFFAHPVYGEIAGLIANVSHCNAINEEATSFTNVADEIHGAGAGFIPTASMV